MFTHEDVYTNARFAGRVNRYHTWPVINGQTNGEHTWQVLRIYYQIFGAPAPEVTTFILWHDAGELYTGDSPGMVKQEVPELKTALDLIERRKVLDMGGNLDANLSGSEKLRVKACDLLDVYEFGQTEVLQGNRLAEPIVRWAEKNLAGVEGKMSREDFDKIMPYWFKIREWYTT